MTVQDRLSLLTGLPLAWSLARRTGRKALVLADLAGGFILLWPCALLVLCGVQGVCP